MKNKQQHNSKISLKFLCYFYITDTIASRSPLQVIEKKAINK